MAPSYSGYRLYHFFITLNGKQRTEIVVWGKVAMRALFKWEHTGDYSEENTNAFMKNLEELFSTINGKTFDLESEQDFKRLTEYYKVVEVPHIKVVMDREGVEGLVHEFFVGRDLRNGLGITVPEQLYLAKLLIERE